MACSTRRRRGDNAEVYTDYLSPCGILVQAKEALKGARRMPWLSEAMKDAVSCENPGLGANGP